MDATVKYGAAGLLLGSIFFLVYVGKVDPNLYVNIAIGALTGLGVYHAAGSGNGNGSGSDTPPLPPSTQQFGGKP